MSSKELKVYNSMRLMLPIFIAVLALVLVLFVVLSEKYKYALLISALIPAIPLGICIIRSLLFFVKVSDDTFFIRTHFGRKFSFDISEINKVSCSIASGGNYSEILIVAIRTQSEKIEINSRLNGFEELTQYLLKKNDSLPAKAKFITDNCQNKLQNHNGGKYLNVDEEFDE